MSRLTQCADLHVGKSRNLPTYLERQSLMLDAIYQVAEDHGDKFVVIVGDIYDRLVLTPKEKDLFLNKIAWADNNGFTTVMESGNHDCIDESENGYSHLRTIKNLITHNCLKNTYVVESKPDWLHLPKFGVCFLCWPAAYGKSEIVNQTIRDLSVQARSKIKDPNTKYIALIHECVTGSSNDSGFAFKGVVLDQDLPVDVILLGDIHKKQKIPGVHAWYCGSPIQHDFGDEGGKGVLVWDLDNLKKPTFHSLADFVPELVTIQVADDQSVESLDIPENAYVRIEASREKIAEMSELLPANVVKTHISIQEKDINMKTVSVDDKFGGLSDILQEMGLKEDGVSFCMTLVNRLQG